MIISLILSFVLVVQPTPQEEVWYVWLDTPAEVNGKEVRLVGSQVFSITCCVKSGKFTRLEKSAAKWVRKHHDPSYDQEHALKKIQNESLAMEVVSKAHAEAEGDPTIMLVDYTATCQ